MASEASTYPFEVVRRRMQMQGGRSSTSMCSGEKRANLANTLRSIVAGRRAKSVAGTGRAGSGASQRRAGYYTYEMFKLLLEVD